MGTHRNGDSMPPEGDRSPDESPGLPDLPELPDDVIIPDDARALAAEAEAIRAELRAARSDSKAQRERDNLPWFAGDGTARRPEPSVGVPLIIMAIAVVITTLSMLAMVISGGPDTRAPSQTRPPVPEVVLTDVTGQATNLASLPPVVILLVESCTCDGLIADTARAAPPGVTVVAVGRTPPPQPDGLPAGAAGALRLLGDPEGELRSALRLGAPPTGAATVVLADREGIVRTTPAANTVESYADALAGLGR